MNWESAILWFVAFLVSATLHEAAHATVALLGGDRTAYLGGQVTLNPLPHMQREPLGMIALPLLSLWLNDGEWCFGFASTPISPTWAYHHPRKAALMSAAGPLANLLLATIAFGVLWSIGRPESPTAESIQRIAGTFLVLNLILFLFNLIPLPPLDGAGVVRGLARPLETAYQFIERLPYVAIVSFVVANALLPTLFVPLMRQINHWLPWPYWR